MGALFCPILPSFAFVIRPDHNFPQNPTKAYTLVEIMIVVVIIGLLASTAVPAFSKLREAGQDKAVLNNARQLAAAADQYFMETGRSTVTIGALVGLNLYIKDFATVAAETYPTSYTQGQPITVIGIGGARTITYSP